VGKKPNGKYQISLSTITMKLRLCGVLLTCLAWLVLFHAILANAQTFPTNGLFPFHPFNENTNDASGSGFNGTNSGAILKTDRLGNATPLEPSICIAAPPERRGPIIKEKYFTAGRFDAISEMLPAQVYSHGNFDTRTHLQQSIPTRPIPIQTGEEWRKFGGFLLGAVLLIFGFAIFNEKSDYSPPKLFWWILLVAFVFSLFLMASYREVMFDNAEPFSYTIKIDSFEFTLPPRTHSTLCLASGRKHLSIVNTESKTVDDDLEIYVTHRFGCADIFNINCSNAYVSETAVYSTH
jgi:hypothetical protein